MIERIAIIILSNLLFYLRTINYNYVSDDLLAFRNPLKFRNKWEKVWLQLIGKLKVDCKMEHLITIMFHALVCVGIYLGFGRNDISFIASLLFAFNPINNQGSVWMSGRGYVIATLGMVWALVFPVLSPFFLFGATYYNAGYFMPITLIGSSHPYILLFMPLIWMFHMKRFKKNVLDKMKMEVFTEDKKIHPKKLILATKTFGFYVIHALIPIKTTFYHSLLESIAGSKAYRAYTFCRFFWIGAGTLSLMLWFCVGIAPFLNLYRMQQELSERYAYLPCVGLMFILATFIHSYPLLVGGWVMMYAVKMWFYLPAYKDDFWTIEYSRFNSPDSWFAWHLSAMKRWETNSIQEAIIYWVIAKNISPKEFKILFNIAAALVVIGNNTVEPKRSELIREGLGFLAEAEKNVPGGQEEMASKMIADFRKGQVYILI